MRVRRVGEGVLDHRRRWSGVVCVWNFMWMPRIDARGEMCQMEFDDGWKEGRWGERGEVEVVGGEAFLVDRRVGCARVLCLQDGDNGETRGDYMHP